MNTRDSKRILSVTITREVDTDPDTSYMGEFSDTPEEYAIVHVGEHSGEFVSDLPCECGHSPSDHNNNGQCMDNCDCEDFDQVAVERGREYRYFNVTDNYKGEPDEDIRKYAQQDYARMNDLNNGGWSFIGVNAVAEVQLANSHAIQRITSGGLWGIESDQSDADFREVESEQLDELKTELHAIGFSKRAVTAAFRNIQHKDA